MNIYQFMDQQPVLAWLAIVLTLYCGMNLIGTIAIRMIRCITICVRGWPPAHLDADGDFKPEPEAEE